jgi:predicted glycosyltransferase involved in capsule biosynthesis
MATKIDLSDCTFNIPIRVESDDRKRNITLVLDYIQEHFTTNVIICEQDSKSHMKEIWKPEWSKNCQLIFLDSMLPIFHKTRCLNEMVDQSKTPFLISHDSDVLLKPECYKNARDILRSGRLDFCYPFDKPLHNIPKILLEDIKGTVNLDTFQGKTEAPHTNPPPGGCFFINKDKFLNFKEDENYYGYGNEDISRLVLVQRLGYKVASLPGILYHFEHVKIGSSAEQHEFRQQNENEFNKIKHLPIELLKVYIKSWSWVHK